jgi:hypothetical protein
MTSAERPQHPSFLELDRLALGAPPSHGTAAHVASCARCRGHLEGVREAPPLPPGLRERARGDGADGGLLARLRRRWLLGALGLAGAMAAAAVLLLARPQVQPDGGYIGEKGLPSVWVYVKHDTELRLWDGEQPLAPGDRLRLKIDPQGHTHADVFTQAQTGAALEPVWSGTLEPDEVTTLPAAWQLDRSGGDEALIVVLAQGKVSPAQARRFVDKGAPRGVWLRKFLLRKTAAEPAP